MRVMRSVRWAVLSASAVAMALALPSVASAANNLGVHGSVNQVYVAGAQPGTSLRLIDRKDRVKGCEKVKRSGGKKKGKKKKKK